MAYKEEVHIAAYDGQRECFSKTGAVAILRSVTIERLIHESIHSTTRDTRERNRKKKREHFLEFTIILNDMMREEISENEGMTHLYYSSFLCEKLLLIVFF